MPHPSAGHHLVLLTDQPAQVQCGEGQVAVGQQGHEHATVEGVPEGGLGEGRVDLAAGHQRVAAGLCEGR